MEGTPAATTLLLQQPREIRDLIWECLLSSTILTSGEALTDGISSGPVEPSRNSLALLRTCRQIHHETKDIWLKVALFDFSKLEYLLDKLSPLPPHIMSQIHRVRVGSQN